MYIIPLTVQIIISLQIQQFQTKTELSKLLDFDVLRFTMEPYASAQGSVEETLGS